MFRTTRTLGLALTLLFSGSAFSQSIELDDFGEEEEEEGEEERSGAADDDIMDMEDPDDDDWVMPDVDPDELDDEEGINLDDEFEDDTFIELGGPGQDTARIYREQQEEVRLLGPDEEALAWERYLRRYYNSVFRERIEARLDELADEMYSDVNDPYTQTVDAGQAEIRLAQSMTMDSIDPRNKIRVGFEMGLPEYLGLTADLERQIWREFSVHGGFRGRPTGENVEIGVKYALIKSARTQTLVTLLADFHLNINPVHYGIRPQLGIGQRFEMGEYHLDASMVLGTDVLFVRDNAQNLVTSPRFVAGTNLTFAASDIVRVFLETGTYMKDTFEESISGGFRFNTVVFGLRFINRQAIDEERFDVGVGAVAPYAYQWWGFHSGSIATDAIYFMD